MVRIEATTFLMGTGPEEVAWLCSDYLGYGPDEYDAEGPQRPVNVGSFWIDVFPVTNADYAKAVDEGVVLAPVYWQHPKWSAPNHPVVGVGWYDAAAYAVWRGARLPSEEEWECAASWDPARSRKLRFPWGDGWDPTRCLNAEQLLGDRISGPQDWAARFWTSRQGIDHGRLEPVGIRDDASPYGARMMVGHVWEWTSSNWDDDDALVVVRGGSWVDDRNSCRGAYRTYTPRAMWRYGASDIGFRCASDQPPDR